MEVNTTQNSNDMAKLQIQYSLLLKENDLLRNKQEHLIEDNRLLKVQLEKEKLESRDPLWTSMIKLSTHLWPPASHHATNREPKSLDFVRLRLKQVMKAFSMH
jgi:hypothetical protein